MIRSYLVNSIRFVILVLAQVLLFNHIELGGFIQPYIYVLFILLLPFETPGWLLLILSFLLGLTIDLFMNSPGFHTSATVFMAFLRPAVLKTFSPREGYDTGTLPRIHYYGLEWFAKYAFLLIGAHHLFLFTVEVFRFSEFHLILARGLMSTAVSGIFIILSQFFFFRR